MCKTKMITLMMMLCFLVSCASFSESRFGFRTGMEDSEVQAFVSRIRPSQQMLANDYKYACFLKDRQKYQLAIQEFEKILAMDPAHVKSLNAAGICYDRLGDYDNGISFYKKALDINPRLDYVHNNLGYSFLLAGKSDAAVNAFQKAIRLNDQDQRYHNNLALAYFKTGQYRLASKQIKDHERADFYRKLAFLNKKAEPAKAPDRVAVHPAQPEKAEPRNDAPKNNDVPKNNDAPKLETALAGVLSDSNTAKKAEPNRKSPGVLKAPKVRQNLKVRKSAKVHTRSPQRLPHSAGIEISNGNGVRSMAAKVGNFLKKEDFSVTRLTNAAHFGFKKTKIFYCPGYMHEAYEVAKQIPGWQDMDKVAALDRSGIKIKVLIGQDMIEHKSVFFDRKKGHKDNLQLAGLDVE